MLAALNEPAWTHFGKELGRQCLVGQVQMLDQPHIPQRVQVAAAHERLELVLIAPTVLGIACVQRLVDVGDEMDDVLQSGQTLLFRCD